MFVCARVFLSVMGDPGPSDSAFGYSSREEVCLWVGVSKFVFLSRHVLGYMFRWTQHKEIP